MFISKILLASVGFFWTFIYWFLIFIALISGSISYWPSERSAKAFGIFSSNLVLLILLAIVGYAALGWPN